MNNKEAGPPTIPVQQKKRSKCFWFSAVVFALSFFTILVLSFFVVPVFAEMFADFGAELPKPTQVVIGLSDFTKSYMFFIQLPIAAFLAFAIWALIELDKRQKRVIMIFVGALPLGILLILVCALFLPVFQLSSVVGVLI